MRSESRILRRELTCATSVEKQRELLKNRFLGHTAFVVACGNSLQEYEELELRMLLRDRLVLTIKQAYNVLADSADFHLLNRKNLIKYSYEEESHPVVLVVHSQGTANPVPTADVALSVLGTGDAKQSLMHSRCFEENTLDARCERRWGPGIMNEVGFYLPFHLGVKRIVTLGWDLEKPGPSRDGHFYGQQDRWSQARPKQPAEHDLGTLGDQTDMSESWFYWLSSHSVELLSATRETMIHDCIPRVRLERVL